MLEQALLELEEKTKSMTDELATIRKYVVQLEEDNRALQSIIRKKNTSVSAKGNLSALFGAGFHVCPSHFGEVREDEGECLFCISFMEKEGQKKEEKIEPSDENNQG